MSETLGVTTKVLKASLSKRKFVMVSSGPVLASTTYQMAAKLKQYESILSDEWAELAQILDIGFNNDILYHSRISRGCVSVLITESQVCIYHTNFHPSSRFIFLKSPINENSQRDASDIESVSFPRATATHDKCAKPFNWWKSNGSATLLLQF